MNQQALETLTFKIGLSGTFWKKAPAFSIWVDDIMYSSGVLTSVGTSICQFTVSLTDDSVHLLRVRLENKDDSDTVVENDTIVKDMLLNIESIEIDDIELGQVKWDESTFIPDDTNNKPTLTKCVNLGWNGTYTLPFRCPYYLWLLEKV